MAGEERGPRRGRRGRGGRGRDREPRDESAAESCRRSEGETAAVEAPAPVPVVERPAQLELTSEVRAASPDAGIGLAGERLTRAEAFDLVRRTVADLAPGDEAVRASDVRRRARQLLGRDSESLSDRMFVRILKDAHDSGVVDLRRRGDDFDVARAVEAAPVAEQVAKSEQAAIAASAPAAPSTPAPRIGWDIAAQGCAAVTARRRQDCCLSASSSGASVSARGCARVPSDNGERRRRPLLVRPVVVAVAERPPRKRRPLEVAAPPVATAPPAPAAKAKRGQAAKKSTSRPRAKKSAAGPKDQ